MQSLSLLPYATRRWKRMNATALEGVCVCVDKVCVVCMVCMVCVVYVWYMFCALCNGYVVCGVYTVCS